MGRGLKVILFVQAVIALALIGTDVRNRWPTGVTLEDSPARGPVSPGDQVRIYEPNRVSPEFLSPVDFPGVDLPKELPPRLSFTMHADAELGEFLLLNGGIERDDAKRLESFLAVLENPPLTVALSSPGGIVEEALEIGKVLRERQIKTAVLPGMACVSACPYILAGGAERRVSRNSIVGLHQHYYETPGYMPVYFAVNDIQRGQGKTMEYLIEMGVNPGIMAHGLSTPPNDIYVLVEEELLASQLATHMTD